MCSPWGGRGQRGSLDPNRLGVRGFLRFLNFLSPSFRQNVQLHVSAEALQHQTVCFVISAAIPLRSFSNATKRWKQAVSGSECLSGSLSVIIKTTSMNLDQQKQVVEIANEALDRCGMENEIATFI